MTYLVTENDAHRLGLDELSTLAPTTIPVDEPYRMNVDLGGVVLPLLVVRRDSAERLVVLNDGAVNLERSARRPVFQRSSWWMDIQAHQIYVCDPGTVGEQAMPINWLQLPHPQWRVKEIVMAIVRLSRVLGTPLPHQRLYYGSSAGGFATLLELAYDRQARAVVNNPQIDWTRWHAHQVKPVLESRFPGRNAQQVRERMPKRAICLQNLADSGTRARVDYWVNMASAHDRDVQLPVTQAFLRENPEICADFSLHMYFNEVQGHNPMSKEKTLEILNEG